MAIPKTLKISVWTKVWGPLQAQGLCYVCARPISNQDFDGGHITAKANGGDDSLDNLLPICRACNGSMHTMNLEDFKAKYYPNVKVVGAKALIKPRQTKTSTSRAKCPNCKGKGTLPPRGFFSDTAKCPSCHSIGTVVATRFKWVKCPKCQGYGTKSWSESKTLLGNDQCQTCRGAGIVPPKTKG